MRFVLPPAARVDMTPLVGVLLVLMTVFMAATSPPTGTQQLDEPPDMVGSLASPPLFISVMGRDTIYIGGHKMSLAALDDTLAALPPGSHKVLLRGDKDIDYGTFMTVLSRLKHDGYAVGLINEDIE